MIPKQMMDALRKAPKFSDKTDSEIEQIVAGMTLNQLVHIKGIAYPLATQYAKDSGRVADLYTTNWDLDDNDWRVAAIAHYEEELKKDFSTETANDRANLHQLAVYYAMREQLAVKMVGITDDAGGHEVARIGNLMAKINADVLNLERHLELDPAARIARASQDMGASVISELVEAAAQMVKDELASHDTDHGFMGWTAWAVPVEKYMPHCAQCGSRELVFTSPWDYKAYPFEVATQDQMDRYVFARDFTPEGAPKLPIFETEDEGVNNGPES